MSCGLVAETNGLVVADAIELRCCISGMAAVVAGQCVDYDYDDMYLYKAMLGKLRL